MTDERNFYQDMANDYSQLQDEYQDQRIQLERLMSTSADGNADVAQQSMRMEGRAVEKGADARGNTELKKYREMTRQLLQAAEQHSEQLKKENEELREELRVYSADVDVDDITPEQRAVVRMALQKLNALGIVETRTGSGTFVIEFDFESYLKTASRFYEQSGMM